MPSTRVTASSVVSATGPGSLAHDAIKYIVTPAVSAPPPLYSPRSHALASIVDTQDSQLNELLVHIQQHRTYTAHTFSPPDAAPLSILGLLLQSLPTFALIRIQHHHSNMCDYTQREYSCGHFRWIASKWCKDYTITHKRCQPNVTHFEYRYGAARFCSRLGLC